MRTVAASWPPSTRPSREGASSSRYTQLGAGCLCADGCPTIKSPDHRLGRGWAAARRARACIHGTAHEQTRRSAEGPSAKALVGRLTGTRRGTLGRSKGSIPDTRSTSSRPAGPEIAVLRGGRDLRLIACEPTERAPCHRPPSVLTSFPKTSVRAGSAASWCCWRRCWWRSGSRSGLARPPQSRPPLLKPQLRKQAPRRRPSSPAAHRPASAGGSRPRVAAAPCRAAVPRRGAAGRRQHRSSPPVARRDEGHLPLAD
jgi:hypothetical protein